MDGLDRTAGAIRGRAARVIHVVTSEMDNYEPGVYTEKVLEATKLLSDTGKGRLFPGALKCSCLRACGQLGVGVPVKSVKDSICYNAN